MSSKNETKLHIYLADLRHNYQGTAAIDAMPLGMGYMKAVLDDRFPEKISSEVFAFASDLDEALEVQIPDILFLSNYMWNEQLSLHYAHYVKSLNKNCLVVMGGPNIPLENERKILYFRSLKCVDLYATGEGDFFVAELVELFLKEKRIIKRLLKNMIHSSVYLHNDQDVVVTPILPRSRNLDEIPSPWLTGVMDKFFHDRMVPLFETNRGCPFTCSFCVQGTKWYHRVNHFSLERIKEEVEYIGAMIDKISPEQKMLRIADPNFGMYERDIEISSYLGETQQKYNWPLYIDATTGKNRANNIIKSIEKVNGALIMYQAVQSLDEYVLENIQRKNIKLETYEEVQMHIRGRGLRSSSDLILGLPGQSLKSHKESLSKLINSGTHKLNNFQSMMLKGSELETDKERDRYGFKTKFRLLPKSFGLYRQDYVFDVDEIIVETDSLPFDDYVTARTYHFLISALWNESRFAPIITYMNNLGIDSWEFIETVYQWLMRNHSDFMHILEEFINETKGELFDSVEAVYSFYSQPENFERAVRSEIGDNLMYKYRAMVSFWYWDQACHVVRDALGELLIQNVVGTVDWKQFWSDLNKYLEFIHSYGEDIESLLTVRSVNLTYDIESWIQAGSPVGFEDYKFEEMTLVDFVLPLEKQQLFNGVFQIWDYTLKSLPMIVKRIHNSWQEREVKVRELAS